MNIQEKRQMLESKGFKKASYIDVVVGKKVLNAEIADVTLSPEFEIVESYVADIPAPTPRKPKATAAKQAVKK